MRNTRRVRRATGRVPRPKQRSATGRHGRPQRKKTGRVPRPDPPAWGSGQLDAVTSSKRSQKQLELQAERPRRGKERLIAYGSSPIQHAMPARRSTGRVAARGGRRGSGPPLPLVVGIPCLLLLLGAALLIAGSDSTPPRAPAKRSTAPAITAPAPARAPAAERPARPQQGAERSAARDDEPELSPAEEAERIKAVAERERQLQAAEDAWLEELGKRTE